MEEMDEYTQYKKGGTVNDGGETINDGSEQIHVHQQSFEMDDEDFINNGCEIYVCLSKNWYSYTMVVPPGLCRDFIWS